MHKEALLCLFLEPITSILSREKKLSNVTLTKELLKMLRMRSNIWLGPTLHTLTKFPCDDMLFFTKWIFFGILPVSQLPTVVA